MTTKRGSQVENSDRSSRGGARNSRDLSREDHPSGARSHQPRHGGPKNTHRP